MLISSESQTSLSLKAEVLTQPTADMASTAESSKPSMLPVTNGAGEGRGSDEADYITGLKLHIILFGLTLVGFVIMLDQTIVATVRGILNI
jgi:hypothetical protein